VDVAVTLTAGERVGVGVADGVGVGEAVAAARATTVAVGVVVKVGVGAGDGVLLGVGVGLATWTGVDEAVAVAVGDAVGSALPLASADAGHSNISNAAYINGLIAETSRHNLMTRPTSLRAPKHQVMRRRRAVSPDLTTALVQAPVSQWQTALSVRPQCNTRIVPRAMGQMVPSRHRAPNCASSALHWKSSWPAYRQFVEFGRSAGWAIAGRRTGRPP